MRRPRFQTCQNPFYGDQIPPEPCPPPNEEGTHISPTLARAAVDADLTERVIAIVNANYRGASAYPEVIRAFAVALQKAETPRMKPLSFIRSEGSKGGEVFERYGSIEFSVTAYVIEIDANRKLELL